MSAQQAVDETAYQVVVNHEEQFSIWPAHRPLPPGWRADGPAGSASACLEYIEGAWTDMRALSVRPGGDSHNGH